MVISSLQPLTRTYATQKEAKVRKFSPVQQPQNVSQSNLKMDWSIHLFFAYNFQIVLNLITQKCKASLELLHNRFERFNTVLTRTFFMKIESSSRLKLQTTYLFSKNKNNYGTYSFIKDG